jgi:hypothetical protein
MSLLWLPPAVQEVFDPSARVIECGLLSGLFVRHFRKPLAGMVICGSGPDLGFELKAQSDMLVFLIQICSIVSPIRVVAFFHSLHPRDMICLGVRQALSAPDLDNPHSSSASPR